MIRQAVIALLLLSFAVLSLTVSTARAQQMSVEEATKAMCGTWVNNQYEGERAFPQKIVFKTDRTFDAYMSASQQAPTDKGDFTILDVWQDSSGCTYCHATTKSFYLAGSSFELWKFDKTRDTWESQFSFRTNAFAKEITLLTDTSKGSF